MTNASKIAFFAVCDANGPISVALDGETAEEALESFAALDRRAAIDAQRTDVEDTLGIAGDGMSEGEFDFALAAVGAELLDSLGAIDRHSRPIAGDWYLWRLVGDPFPGEPDG